MTPIEFLTARLDEDEAVARAAHVETVLPTMWRPELLGQGPFMEHIVRFDPARVLADVAAKRAIVQAWIVADAAAGPYPGTDAGVWLGLDEAVHLLAQPYVEHPDFDPAWRL